jgi:RNA polymerase sigma-70 factor, ECF subfamily
VTYSAADKFPSDLEELFPLVYNELRRLAARYLTHEAHTASLQPTALVNEAYLKLNASEPLRFNNRSHFFAVAGRVMRQVLVDRARSKLAVKRGQRPQQTSLHDVPALAMAVLPVNPELVVAVHEALSRFEGFDPRRARIVELKCFAGLSNEEVAETVGSSASTVKRDWDVARAWLHRELS